MDEIRCVLEETQVEADLKSKITERPVEEEEEEEEHEEYGGGERSMEEIRCVLKETQVEADPKLKIVERQVEEKEENEEEYGGGSDIEEEGDDDDDAVCWDENGDPCLPFIGHRDPPISHCSAARSYTIESAQEIYAAVDARNHKLLGEWYEMFNNNMTPLPVIPVVVLPKITDTCVSGGECYHQRYWTEINSETDPDHPYFRPCGMMQVFSLSLSSPVVHAVNIYGSFSVRDCWEPLRNYLFKRTRDDPAIIPQGCSLLPLCSPCRGIYVLQYILIDVDLWIKEDGDGSADKLLFSGYVEMNTSLTGFGTKLEGRFQGDHDGLEMRFSFLPDSVETVIEVLAKAEHPSDVKISASTSGFDDEITLYDGTFCGTGRIVRHFIAAEKLGELHVFFKLDGSLYKWTFQAGVGVIVAPEHPVSGFAQYFVMNVSFRTRGKAASAWQWSCVCNEVRLAETCL